MFDYRREPAPPPAPVPVLVWVRDDSFGTWYTTLVPKFDPKIHLRVKF